MSDPTKNDLAFDFTQELIQNYIKTITDENISVDLSLPVHNQHGNFTTNIALRLAKINKQNSKMVGKSESPKDIAQKICEYIEKNKTDLIDKVEIAGPGLINIFLTPKANAKLIKNIVTGSKDNFVLNTDAGLHWVIEHTSPNPNKAMHLGHLRNNLVGMSLANLIENCGGQVTRDAVDNNRGIAIAKAMYGFLVLMKKPASVENFGEARIPQQITLQEWIENKNNWYTPNEKNIRPDVFVADCYVGCSDLIKNDTTGNIENKVRQMVLDWENKDEDTWALWQHILDYSYAGMQMTLTRLGNKWDKIWHEHEHYQKGKDYVQMGLDKGIFKKLDDGAVLTQIEESYNIPETILLKNDGTALYITQDIALTDLKKKSYNADKLVWVVGPEQSLAMKQMFAVCEQLGIGKMQDFIHISYGYMGLKDTDGNFKKMASRDGTVLLIDDLIDTVKDKLLASRLQVQEDPELTEKIAIASIKFSILKCEKNLNMAFDINESINITGDSGVYILYTIARIKSILKEAQNRGIKTEGGEFIRNIEITGEIAQDVIRKIHSYKIMLGNCREHLSTHPLAHYLLELASVFNSWYAVEKVLDDSEKVPEKLAILNAVEITMTNALNILGINPVEKM